MEIKPRTIPSSLIGILAGRMSRKVLPLLVVAAVFWATAIHATAGRVNMAKHQTVTASGQSNTYIADFAVDGIVSNFHSFRTNNTTNPHWLELRYPSAVTIGSAHLYLGLDNDPVQGGLPSFKFQYHDGSSWLDIPGSSITGNTDAERSVIFSSAITSNRFRLYTDENGTRTIRELALFPPNLMGAVEQGFSIGTDVRLSLGYKRPTAASTIYNGNYAKRAVDGHVDDSSRWLCNGTAAGDTLEIDLLDSHVVGSAHLYSGSGTNSNPAQNFILDYWDGTAWQPIPGADFPTNASASLVIPFTTPVTTSKIRYRTTSGNFARIRELLLFPPRIGGYPLGQDVNMSAPPSETWDRYSDSYYRLRNNGPDLRLGLVAGFVVNVAADTNFPSRTEWQLLLNHRDGTYRVRNAESGLCLALSQISLADNTSVTAQEYSGLPHQDWRLSYVDATRFTLVNDYSGLTLEPAYGSWSSGSSLVVRPAAPGSAIQIWTPSLRRHYPKKGIAATGPGANVPWGTENWMQNSYGLFSHSSWSYGWGRQSASVFPYMGFNHAFNPMQWGNYSWTHGSNQGPPENLHRELQATAKPVHYLGFNEPESDTQGFITPADAILRWPRLEALGAPLVSPVPASIQVNSAVSPAVPAAGWMSDFTQQADTLGYRRDCTAVHWYGSPNSSSLINHLEDIYQAYGRTVWLTEFSVVDWVGTGNSWTKASNYNFLAELLWRAESLPWLKRYSLFQYTQGSGSGYDTASAPRSNTRNTDGSLTGFGELYAGWDGVADVMNYRNYHLHNKKEYRRVRNPVSTDLVSSALPDTPSTGNQWVLIPGTTANTVRIVSTLDGRRLRYWSGTYVGMATADNFTGQSEWTLVADQHGWYFLNHPQSGARLRMDTSGTLVHGSGTGATDDYKWRFVAPAVADNTSPILATIPSQTVTEGVLLTFTASATDADLPANNLTYSLVGGPTGASINTSSGVFTWTPTEAQGPVTYNFTIRVNDGSLTHEQPVAVTVIDGGSPEILETWIIAGQSNAEGYGITESPITGLAPSSTLASIGRSNLNVTHNNIQMFQGANESNGITSSAGLSLPARNTWHAMTAYEGLAYDWGSGDGQESGRRFGPELALGYDLQRRLGSSIALIKYARGSTSIAPSVDQTNNIWRDFDPSDGGRLNQYDKLVSTIQAAVNSLPTGQVLKIRGVIWMQGESDATAANAPSYQANLTELISTLRTDIGSIAAASGGKMNKSAASWSELDVFVGTIQNSGANYQTVINAQNSVAAADANVFTVNGTSGLSVMTNDDWNGSGIHYDTAGQVLLGERFADAALSRLVRVSESGGATSVTEGGATDTYTVTLTRAPSADVIINITTDSQVSVSPTSLTFTTGNWSTPQTVTVTAVDDIVDEADHSGSISHSLSSSDLSYDGLSIHGVTAGIIDNDPNFNSYVGNPAYGIGENDRDFNDDPDGDGLANGLEAFFGTHPGQSNTGFGATITNRTTTTFTHPHNPNLPEDLTIAYEWSPDLTSWYAGNGTAGPPEGASVTITSQTTDNTTTVTAVSDASQEKIFLRAVVRQN